ncbi:hypothetical protein F5Y14DRAFT_453076 [Nemania sp. NC0429]|nr:hypothetical protein F5Y14DRAFT_453076 [Nemania sp. NC0429]
MSSGASTTIRPSDRGHWHTLTSLHGFEISPEPPLTRTELQAFCKAIKGSTPWCQFASQDIVLRVTAIFYAACQLHKTRGGEFQNNVFYTSLATKMSGNSFKNPDIYREVVRTYVDGLKNSAALSESHVYVHPRSAPVALSVAAWIKLTEGTIITITTKPLDGYKGAPRQQNSHKRSVEVLDDDDVDNREAKARKTQLKQVFSELDDARQKLDNARQKFEEIDFQKHNVALQLKAARIQSDTQAEKLVKAKQDLKKKTAELQDARDKEEWLLRRISAARQDGKESLANLKRLCEKGASEHYVLVKAAIIELALSKQERDESQRKLADCAGIIKSLNAKLSGKNESA